MNAGKYNVMLASLVALALGACGGGSQDGADTAAAPEVAPADLVLRGGKVATVDPALGNAEAIAVNGYRITAVGSNDEISAYIGPDTEVIELNGRFAMPGFIEGHGHYMSLGRAKQILDLTRVNNWEEIVTMVAGAVDKSQPGEWIFGRGWHQDKWDSVPENAVDGVPRNDTLNAVSPDNPVSLGHASGHAGFFNDAALAAAGIDDETADPPGGTIVRTPDGRATGLMRETAQRLLNEVIGIYEGRLTPEEMEQIDRQRAMLAADEALAHGVTSFQDAGSSFETIDFFKELEEEGNLPVRLYVMVRRESNELMDQALPQYKMLPEGNDYLTVRSIKRQIDGALGSHGAWLLEPYVDLPDTAGLVLENVEDIEGTAELAIKHGFQVNTHAIGDRAVRETLDIYERAWKAAGVDGKELRWRIEHSQHIDPLDVPRFGGLGVIAVVQAIHGTSDGPWIPSRLGEERAKSTSQPWRALFNTGAIITNGTDVPVEPIDPISSYYASVSRMMINGERFYPEHVMTREEALTSYTLNNAIAAFEEDIKGTLTPGKYADIVVLSQDLLTVEEAKIPETTVDITIVGGEIKYRRGMQ
ncbi:MAG: amidohydrolase [Proteobacteria bacterium]|nr:amidohydrolase [Pseudomonadota bacterium]